MPLYEFKCPRGEHVIETFFHMSDLPGEIFCATHNSPAPRHFSPRSIARFTEDRMRFFKGYDGSGYSTALGCKMPETRRERDRLAAEKGIEFVSPQNMPEEWKEAVDYVKHVETGGERLEDPASFYDVSGFNATDTRPDYMKERARQ